MIPKKPREKSYGNGKKELPIKGGLTVRRLYRRFSIENHFAVFGAIGEMESEGEAFFDRIRTRRTRHNALRVFQHPETLLRKAFFIIAIDNLAFLDFLS
jgi:hypothetical protein